MKNLKFTRQFCSVLLGGAIVISSLSGCGTNNFNNICYEIVLDNLENGDNSYALDYVNSLGFTSEEFRLSFYNYLAEGNGNCFINAQQEDVVAIELSEVNDLTDLRLFPNLKKVKISNSKVSDFSQLCELSKLEAVEFDNMEVDCSTLSELKTELLSFNKVAISNSDKLINVTGVTNMLITYSHFGNIDFIDNWSEINTLTLQNADIDDFSVLSNKKIDHLSINFCQVDDWAFIKSMQNLEFLDVSYTNFSDISLITGLKKLAALDLSYSLINNVDGISNLKKLENLSLDSCQNLDNYDEVTKLKKLKSFNCTNLEMQTNISTITTIMNNCDEVIACDINIKKKVEELYNSLNITDDMSDSQKVQIITSAVLDLISYNTDATVEDVAYYNTHELKSAIDGKGMCASYTGLTCALLDLANIENYSIVGENIEDNEEYLHRWVVVKVDEKLVGLDTTFLDDLDASEKIKRGEDSEYYLDDLSDEVWQEFHYPYFMPNSEQKNVYNLAR